MELYDIRIWGKSQRDFISFKCFSDCIPFEVREDYFFEFPTREQNEFMEYVIERIHTDEEFETEFEFKQFWLKSVLDISHILVCDITSNFHTISVNDLKKES